MKMRFPLHVVTDMVTWQLRNWICQRERYPYVLMLEPLHTCNLRCLGCSPERYNGKLEERLPLHQCFKAVDETRAPVVSICGGEPTIYPELLELVEGIIARKRHTYLCTNGLLLDRFYRKSRPHTRLSINVHLDGMSKTHDFLTDRAGVFDRAIEMIKEGKRLGYRICTNTTIFRETDMDEIEEMFAHLRSIGVDGMLVSPGYHYEKIPENHFLFRDEIHRKFKRVLQLSEKYRLYSTPFFLEFAAGERDYPCTPWGNPTRTPKGWKGPCYLVEDAYYQSWNEFWQGVDWSHWETRQDPRCHNCLMHSGFEPSVVRKLGESAHDLWTMIQWNFFS
jgi:hopanoid biosynthesis associated radical SAM protein HpnH